VKYDKECTCVITDEYFDFCNLKAQIHCCQSDTTNSGMIYASIRSFRDPVPGDMQA
jgi:hypothetical protein